MITAGGTRERIDSVRTITNDATGKLGSLIANKFSQKLAGLRHTIYYLCGTNAELPAVDSPSIQIIRIEGTRQLEKEIKRLLSAEHIDVMVHSMAVSDYRVSTVTTQELIAENIGKAAAKIQPLPKQEEWENILSQAFRDTSAVTEGKMSSNLEHPVLLLEKTPKIIGMIKDTSPETLLVGFKLLSGVSEEKLIETAYDLLKKNRCDFVLANDTDSLSESGHKGVLIDKSANCVRYVGKEQIAAGIVENVLKELQV